MTTLANEEAAAIGFAWAKELFRAEALKLKPNEARVRRIVMEFLVKVGNPQPGEMAQRLAEMTKKKEEFEAKSEDLT